MCGSPVPRFPGLLTAGSFYQHDGFVFYDVHSPENTGRPRMEVRLPRQEPVRGHELFGEHVDAKVHPLESARAEQHHVVGIREDENVGGRAATRVHVSEANGSLYLATVGGDESNSPRRHEIEGFEHCPRQPGIYSLPVSTITFSTCMTTPGRVGFSTQIVVRKMPVLSIIRCLRLASLPIALTHHQITARATL